MACLCNLIRKGSLIYQDVLKHIIKVSFKATIPIKLIKNSLFHSIKPWFEVILIL